MPAIQTITSKKTQTVTKKAKNMHTVKKSMPQRPKQNKSKAKAGIRKPTLTKRKHKNMPRIVVLSTNPNAMDDPGLQHVLKVLRKFMKEGE